MSGVGPASLAGTMNMSVRNGGPIAENATGGINLQNNGQALVTGAGAVGTNWYNPAPTTAIGASFWVRATRTGGAGSTTILGAGVWTSLASAVAFSAGGGAGSSTGIFEFATDSGGVNIVASYPFSVNNTI